jgi:mersacidin/lichenicidin family type 2 lantibiotic
MNLDIVRAWKDEEYRQSLSEEERRNLPGNPVGELELTDADLEVVYGGWKNHRGSDGGRNSNGCHNSGICSGVCSNGNCNSFVCSIAIFC